MRSLARRAVEAEQMDAADLDARTYAAVLRDLARVNRVTFAARPTLGFLSRAIGSSQRLRVLDIGFGQGDMLRSIARWAKRRGLAPTLTGIDLNPRSAAIAERATPPELAITYLTGDYAALRERYDVVVSSLVAHHMTDVELLRFLHWMEEVADRGWLINDLRRSAIAHAGYPLLARAMRWHRIVREDGTLSIARSFRRPDWEALLARAGLAGIGRIIPRFPFRLCVERLR